jgi:hypothetical protein
VTCDCVCVCVLYVKGAQSIATQSNGDSPRYARRLTIISMLLSVPLILMALLFTYTIVMTSIVKDYVIPEYSYTILYTLQYIFVLQNPIIHFSFSTVVRKHCRLFFGVKQMQNVATVELQNLSNKKTAEL